MTGCDTTNQHSLKGTPSNWLYYDNSKLARYTPDCRRPGNALPIFYFSPQTLQVLRYRGSKEETDGYLCLGCQSGAIGSNHLQVGRGLLREARFLYQEENNYASAVSKDGNRGSTPGEPGEKSCVAASWQRHPNLCTVSRVVQ